jgi:hypothetical protein
MMIVAALSLSGHRFRDLSCLARFSAAPALIFRTAILPK